MAANERQGEADRPGLTRAAVAKRLGRDISWVRRREGKELHPVLADGAYRFDPAEVDALRQRVAARERNDEEGQEAIERAHRMFDLHLRSPRRFSVEGIAQAVGMEPRTVRAMHTKWADEFLSDVPRLLTRRELRAIEEREEREAEREHAERLANWEREAEERRKQAASEYRRFAEEWKRRTAELARHRSRGLATVRAAPVSSVGLPDRHGGGVKAQTLADLIALLRPPRGLTELRRR